MSNGKKIRMLTVIEEYGRKYPAIHVARRLKSVDVLEVLSRLFITEGMLDWLHKLKVRTALLNRVTCGKMAITKALMGAYVMNA